MKEQRLREIKGLLQQHPAGPWEGWDPIGIATSPCRWMSRCVMVETVGRWSGQQHWDKSWACWKKEANLVWLCESLGAGLWGQGVGGLCARVRLRSLQGPASCWSGFLRTQGGAARASSESLWPPAGSQMHLGCPMPRRWSVGHLVFLVRVKVLGDHTSDPSLGIPEGYSGTVYVGPAGTTVSTVRVEGDKVSVCLWVCSPTCSPQLWG